jgi:glycosyltransferase involved in cell wall biosynthesis
MVAEGYMSGTPAITADWGGFSETVVEGETGFRCRDFGDIISAMENIDSISPSSCRAWAMKNYADDVIHPQFDQYFNKLKLRDFYHV